MKHWTMTLLAALLAALPCRRTPPLPCATTTAMPSRVAKPAQRILALAPHITELLFAAGGGDKIVGVVSYSDYPEAAKEDRATWATTASTTWSALSP